jgi:adenylosuccinate synthase
MPLDIILGAQWGDEGKGRMVDLLAHQAQVVARFGGGDNAGHTVSIGERLFKLHLVPSGCIHPHTTGVLGSAMVVNPRSLLKEFEQLVSAGIDVSPDRIYLSYAAHLITPAHIALDAAQEEARGEGHIGTTRRGIGPAYRDKIIRRGIRAEAMLSPEAFGDAVQAQVEAANDELRGLGSDELLDAAAVAAEYTQCARQLAPYVKDVSRFLFEALSSGQSVLAEGAQGTLLDVDHGTYPYVTSSNPTVAGALAGLGVGPQFVRQVVGVAKAFQTRVGEGAFPTEVYGEMAGRLRGSGENPWDEFGTTTGRPRRVGWLDGVLLRYAVRVNGLTSLALTKLDILTGLDPLRICVAYQRDGETFDDLPLGLNGLETFTPVYEDLPGWAEDVSGSREWGDLPAPAQAYVRRIEELSGVPCPYISVGPERDQLVVK